MQKLDLHIGSKVHCTDQKCGNLVHIVVNPETQEATDVVIESGLMFMKHNRVLPVSVINHATEAAINLNLPSNELESYPEYREVSITEPDSAMQARTTMTPGGFAEVSVPMVRRRLRQGIPSEMAVMGSNTRVETTHETVGHVDHVMVNQQTGLITHVVMRTGLLFHDYRIVPKTLIESVNDKHIYLNAVAEELDALPRYEPRKEDEVLADVQRRLAAEPETYGAVQATMNGEVLQLSGLVRSRVIKYHAEQLAEAIDGIIDVENNLMVDPGLDVQAAADSTDITSQIQAELLSDPRTKDAVIEVIDDGGIIILQGAVESSETRTAAEEIATQPGAISVFNELIVLR